MGSQNMPAKGCISQPHHVQRLRLKKQVFFCKHMITECQLTRGGKSDLNAILYPLLTYTMLFVRFKNQSQALFMAKTFCTYTRILHHALSLPSLISKVGLVV